MKWVDTQGGAEKLLVRRSDLLGGGRFSGQRQRKRRGRPGAWSCWLRSFMASFIVNLGWLGSLTIWLSKHGLGSSLGLLLAEVEVQVDPKRPGVCMNHLAGWTGVGSGSASGAGCWGGGVETGPISHLSGSKPSRCLRYTILYLFRRLKFEPVSFDCPMCCSTGVSHEEVGELFYQTQTLMYPVSFHSVLMISKWFTFVRSRLMVDHLSSWKLP